MGGTHGSGSGFPSLASLSGAGGLAVDEFRRAYFGSCRVGASALLDASKERRKDCEANVLESIEVAGVNKCKYRDSTVLHRSKEIATALTMSPPALWELLLDRESHRYRAYGITLRAERNCIPFHAEENHSSPRRWLPASPRI